MFERPQGGERAILVGVGIGHPVDPYDAAEFKALAASAGALPVAVVLASRPRPDPKYFVGIGKAEEIRARAEALDAGLVLVDQALSPSQERNLEKLTNCRVLDRNGLILDIFAQRARSFEGKLQVELAQLSHLATRLVRGWTHLERQKGGIGLRGPGETQLETDRRLIAKRIRTLRARLDKLARQRDTGRHVRREIPVPTVALVGYTNAGKSTLFNALTGCDTYVADQLFATLDPTVRRIKLSGVGEVVLADTVGFVRALPHELIAAFRSTLQEARDADLLLHVVDASDPQRDERILQVREVLAGIDAGKIRELTVFNKIDLTGAASSAPGAASGTPSPELPRIVIGADALPAQAWVSAVTQAGLAELRAAIAQAVRPNQVRLTLHLKMSAAAVRSDLYRRDAVRAERQCDDGSWHLDVELDCAEVAKVLGHRDVAAVIDPSTTREQRVA
ncbi:MAG TPA: ribosome rescue GTPase HflX [Steroidobacteraceae bacterium]|nr:ribosome rescue GTPase HflX [Steroidobacteraceae bacterium]